MLGKQLLITRLLLCDGLNKCGSPLSEAVGFAMLICFDCHLIEQRNKQTERETDREKERDSNRLDCQSSDSWNRLEPK